MQITSLLVRNFRGVTLAELTSLEDMVVIAGTNGSGKSTIFDAIRLLKSVYGSVDNNEADQWFGEFQLPIDNTPDAFAPLFNDPTKELEIRAMFSLHPDERQFLRKNAEKLVREVVAKDIMGDGGAWRARHRAAVNRQVRQAKKQVEAYVARYLARFQKDLRRRSFEARFYIAPGAVPDISESPVLETIFTVPEPGKIGGLRYHSAQRNYTREQLQNVSINVVEQQRRNDMAFLYGNAQYTNIKQEMASAYVKELVAADAGHPFGATSTISDTLKELFARFFPGKTFLGARPNRDGKVYFPVTIGSSSEHDLDDLSSGEKEIVYGYLRMRNSSPRYSTVLIDEPELHLNPVLIGGLPDFYQRHLGAGLDNQLWLVTHSDRLLRESLGRKGYSIFHMVPQATNPSGANQAIRLSVGEEAQRAVFDLVGDWAAFRPGAKLVIFEGGGEVETDVKIVGQLFPNDRDTMNFLSGGSRDQGRAIHSAIEKSDRVSDIARMIFSICDRDSKADSNIDGKRRFVWDRYHIENYLLEPARIAAVVAKVAGTTLSTSAVNRELKLAAQQSMGQLVRHQLLTYARESFGDILDVSVSPNLPSLAPQIAKKVGTLGVRLTKITAGPLSESSLIAREHDVRAALTSDLKNGDWVATFRGRDILKRFQDKNCKSVPYPVFLNLLLDEMTQKGDKPQGMSAVMDKIRSAH